MITIPIKNGRFTGHELWERIYEDDFQEVEYAGFKCDYFNSDKNATKLSVSCQIEDGMSVRELSKLSPSERKGVTNISRVGGWGEIDRLEFISSRTNAFMSNEEIENTLEEETRDILHDLYDYYLESEDYEPHYI